MRVSSVERILGWVGGEVSRMMEVLLACHPEDLDLLHPTFTTPDLTVLTRLDDLGLVAAAQLLEPDRATIECRVVDD